MQRKLVNKRNVAAAQGNSVLQTQALVYQRLDVLKKNIPHTDVHMGKQSVVQKNVYISKQDLPGGYDNGFKLQPFGGLKEEYTVQYV